MSKATLIDIRLQQADSNIRRNTASFSINYPAADDTAFAASYVIAAAGNKTITPIGSAPAVILVRSDGELEVVVTFADLSTAEFVMSKALLLDAPYTSLVFTNAGVDSVKLSVHQG